MIKLFASDLDGTLFNRYHTSDKVIISGIDKLISEGYYVSVATGRTMRPVEIKRFLKSRKVFVVAMNGAIIKDNHGNLIKEYPIHIDVLKKLLTTFPELDLECSSKDKTYIRFSKAKHVRTIRSYSSKFKLIPSFLYGIYLTNHVYKTTDEEILSKKILKVNCRHVQEMHIEALEKFLKEHSDQLENAPFSKGVYEITSKNVNKSNSLQVLTKHLQLESDEVAVYGDGGNDLEMLRDFKHSYAPSNGSKKAIEVAKNIIGSNYEHAVINHMLETIKKQ